MVLIHPISSVGLAQASEHEQTMDLVDNQSIKSKESTQPKFNILVMGDSLSASYGLDTEAGWVSLLAQEKGDSFHFINASIGGETSSGGLQRFPQLIQQYQPNLVILELGANDALRGQNLLETKRNLEQMIVQCEVENEACKIILLGVRLPTNYGPAYDAFLQKVYRDLAMQYHLVFDPFFLEDVALQLGMMQADGLHPTETAQPFIMRRVSALIDQVINQQ